MRAYRYIGREEKVCEPLCTVYTNFLSFSGFPKSVYCAIRLQLYFNHYIERFTENMDNEHESTLELSHLNSTLDISNLTMTSNGMLTICSEQK